MKVKVFQALIIMNLEGTSEEDGLWRPELSKAMDTPDTTLYDHLDILKRKQLIDKYEQKKNEGRGRPRVYWFLTQKGYIALERIKKGIAKKNEQRRDREND